MGSTVGSLAVVPVMAIAVLAIWLAVASVIESVRFARATDQILGLVATARDYAATERNFAMRPDEDLLATLAHAGLVTGTVPSGAGTSFLNPWRGNVRAVSSLPSAMRLEDDVPVRDCRRLAQFFTQHANDLGLPVMEARDGVWRRFYEAAQIRAPDLKSIEAACGQSPKATLALVFRLRG